MFALKYVIFFSRFTIKFNILLKISEKRYKRYYLKGFFKITLKFVATVHL